AVELSHAEHGIAARPEDEARQLLGLTHPLLARGLKHGEEHRLDQVASAILVPEVAQAVEPDARRIAAAQRALRLAEARASKGDARQQRGVGRLGLHRLATVPPRDDPRVDAATRPERATPA